MGRKRKCGRQVYPKVAFVTGAATGMGQQFALDLAAEGAKVVISDIDGSGLEETGALLKRAGAEYLALAATWRNTKRWKGRWRKPSGVSAGSIS